MTEVNKTAWSLALAGGLCAIGAALIKGGTFEALTAASVWLNGAAGVWGWTSKK